MVDRTSFLNSNFAAVECPICGDTFSKCGLPNHVRRHKTMAETTHRDVENRRSATWWEGWKEGYRLGVRDGRNGERKKGLTASRHGSGKTAQKAS